MKNKLKNIKKEWLQEEYWIKQRSTFDLAKELNCTCGAITYWMKKFEIPRRNDKEATRIAITGDKNPAKRPEVKEKFTGKNNHFFGKHHTSETKQKLSEINKAQADLFRKNIKITHAGEKWKTAMFVNNPMWNDEIKEKHSTKMKETAWKHTGEKSARWRGGITPLYCKIRKSSQMIQWRNAVYKRDNYKCIFCNSNKKGINADHIKAFSKIIHENNIQTFEQAINCQELWNIENGRTLCVPCHLKTDNYGAKAKIKNE